MIITIYTYSNILKLKDDMAQDYEIYQVEKLILNSAKIQRLQTLSELQSAASAYSIETD